MFADLKKAPIFAKSMLGFTSAKLLKASFRRFAFGLRQHCKNPCWASPQQSS